MRGVRTTSALGVAVLFLTACSTSSVVGVDDGSTEGRPDVVTDFGVTDDTITLGILTDLTGPFASLSTGIVQGNQLVYDTINADGGICGRQIELEIQDHGYDVQRAVQLYNQVAPNVLGLTQLIGSPAADEIGLNLIGLQIKSTDTDLTSAISALGAQGVTAVLLTTTPTQTASAVGSAVAGGLNIPLLGNNPVFAPALMDTPAAPALAANLFVESSTAPYSLDSPAAQDLRDRLMENDPDASPNAGQFYGYGVATIYASVIQRACDNGDLTRAGLQTALTGTTDGDTGGIIAPTP